jgi:hypothetical protein
MQPFEMTTALRTFFNEQVRFRLRDGTDVDGGVFIGSTEFVPLKVLQDDGAAYQEEFDLWLNEDWKPEQQLRREKFCRSTRIGDVSLTCWRP